MPTCLPVCEFLCPSPFTFFFLISCRFCLNSYLVSVLYIGNMAGGSVCHCEFWNSCGSNSALLGKHTILSVTKRNQWECVLCKCLGGRGETLVRQALREGACSATVGLIAETWQQYCGRAALAWFPFLAIVRLLGMSVLCLLFSACFCLECVHVCFRYWANKLPSTVLQAKVQLEDNPLLGC